ncbi:DUF2267 domain-containing protein [Micromonospora sp. 4G57]|uniref:DUF2267 domain-containing protein n=1 Tax=Micromonospora sicca TaxID=2202420 RepID=A0ABU5J657_9ACTN|nr:DUF2267 domain-containing protein [Micromonospora sp. 4G57]MDZ5443428.1 DUF2267 domain-containing protein [Micromonospora sp. 4G57]MDZ5488072.1 DUF2267 domain-containing protein [Micromonospora sp. 4G53]
MRQGHPPSRNAVEVPVRCATTGLRITGEVKERERRGSLRRWERRVGQFEPVATLPWDVDSNSVDAGLSGGLLAVRVGKVHRTEPRRMGSGARNWRFDGDRAGEENQVEYQDFINAVATRAKVSTDQAAALTRATLETLADRISAGQAEDLAYQLPEGLDDPLRKPPPLRGRGEHAKSLGLEEFVDRVAARPAVDRALARAGVRAVLTTLREAVSRDEFENAVAQLSKDFWQVIEPVGAGGGRRPGS